MCGELPALEKRNRALIFFFSQREINFEEIVSNCEVLPGESACFNFDSYWMDSVEIVRIEIQ